MFHQGPSVSLPGGWPCYPGPPANDRFKSSARGRSVCWLSVVPLTSQPTCPGRQPRVAAPPLRTTSRHTRRNPPAQLRPTRCASCDRQRARTRALRPAFLTMGLWAVKSCKSIARNLRLSHDHIFSAGLRSRLFAGMCQSRTACGGAAHLRPPGPPAPPLQS